MKGNLLLGTVYVTPYITPVFMTQQMVGTLLLGTVYVSPINSCVYNSVNERESTIGDGIC